LVQIFTGDGKGKTSAALGTVLRALGHDWKVHITFFLKGDYPYGERQTLSRLPNVTISSFGQESFVQPGKIKPAERQQAEAALACAREAMLSGRYDMVVLDEVIVAAAFKLIDIEELLQLIKDKPRPVELILTGRKADPRLVQVADLVTEMVKVKHPYDSGIPARPGSEY
jgi:cob(I)alamin adenosyltransferase